MVKLYEDIIMRPPVEIRDDFKTKPTKSVQQYENNIIQPLVQFRDDFKPKKSVRSSSIILKERDLPLHSKNGKMKLKKMSGFTRNQNNKTADRIAPANKEIETFLKPLLVKKKGVKFVSSLKITFKKPKGEDTLYKTTFSTANPKQ